MDRYTFDFSEAMVTTLTNPLGKQTRYIYSKDTGTKRIARVEGLATDNCAAANKEYEYDDKGFLKSKTDWNNNKTTYIRDQYGRETSRTEAAGTAQARTITIQWHSSLPVPATISEPERVTEYSYDNSARVTGVNVRQKD